MIKVPKKDEYVKFKNYEMKIRSPFMIYADCKSVLVLENNEKQNSDECFANKYQKHIASSYVCKLVCVDDKLNKSLSHIYVKMLFTILIKELNTVLIL